MRYLICAALMSVTALCFSQPNETLLHSCDDLTGVTVSTGAGREGTALDVFAAPEYITEGTATLRLMGTAAPDAEGSTYVSLDLTIEPTDLSNRALLFDAASTAPEASRSLYVRGFNAEDECVMSWGSWTGLLSEEMQTFRLYPGAPSSGLRWEPDEIASEDRTAVTRLRFFTGTRQAGADFDLVLDNVRALDIGPLLHDFDSLDGITVDVGRAWPETVLELSDDERFITQGDASVRISTVSPETATGNSYVAIDIAIPPTDFTGMELLLDAATSTPEESRAFYVRGYNEAGETVLSWMSWSGVLSDQMRTFGLYPGINRSGLAWEDRVVETDDLSGVVKLRLYTGTSNAGAAFDLVLDNVRALDIGPLLHDFDSLDGITVDVGRAWPETVLELSDDERFITQGDASVRISTVSPETATGNSYVAIDIAIPPTDFTGMELLLDAATSTPEESRAFYVRGYNEAGETVLSWMSWQGPLTDEMQTFGLYPGFSLSGLAWEDRVVETDDLSGVVKLRLYTGTSNAGAAFDLHVDNIRVEEAEFRSFTDVTEVKALHPETALVEAGEPRAIIVTPDDEQWRAVADELAATIADATGATLPIVTPDDADNERLAATNAIILGSIVNNMALLHPYSHQLTFADGFYPGDGGYEVRSVPDPWGTGHNIIAVGASDSAGARAGLEALRPYLERGEALVLPPILEVELTGDALHWWGRFFTMDLDERWAESMRNACEQHLERAGTRGLFSRAQSQGLHYALTGREEYARMYVWMIKRTYEWYLTDPDVYGGPWGMDSDFHIYQNIPAWQNVEQCPALTDEERWEVTQILFRWVSEVAPRKVASPGSTRVRHNHQTFPSLGLLYAGHYFSRYYEAFEGEYWIELADGTFQHQLNATKPHCDCNTYEWLTLNHTMTYAMARPDLSYFESGNARVNADYAVMTMSNLGYQVPFGDVGGWAPLGTELRILRMAEWYYRDGRYQWAIDRKMQVRPQAVISSFSMGPDHARVEPSHLFGAYALGLDTIWYDSFGGEEFVPHEHAIDKISFRDSYDPEAPYLLLGGLSVGGHGHMDGNAVLQWTEHDRVWLADADYIKSLPKYHNSVLVLRDGQSERMPGFCELEHLANLDSVAASQSVVRNYAGVDWHRSVIWLKDRFFVVADRMVAVEPGDYSFRAVWRTLGDTDLDGSVLRVEQSGVHAAIAMPSDIRCIVAPDEATSSNWRGYPHTRDTTVQSMQGIIDSRLDSGEQVVLFTVLHSSGEEPSQLAVRRIADNAIAITGVGEPTIVAVQDAGGAMAIPGAVNVTGAMLTMTPSHIVGIGGTEVSAMGETHVEPGGADAEVDLATGMARVLTPIVSSAGTRQSSQTIDIGFAASAAEVRGLMNLIIAGATPRRPAAIAGAEGPELQLLWDYLDMSGNYLITGNPGPPESVDGVVEAWADPEPLEANVFSGQQGMNRLENAFGGEAAGTGDSVMWDDDQEVTIHLRLHDRYDIDRMRLRAWFATSSSREKLFQLGRIRLVASDDGFAADQRVLVDLEDDEMHGNWGAPGHAPQLYEFTDLEGAARELRLVLTPRPGTAVYLAELEIWGSGPGLAELAQATDGPVGYVFNAAHAADLDGDGSDETILGNSNGKLYCFGADGSLLWTFDCGHAVNTVTAVDFRGDGRPAVVAGTMNSQVVAVSGEGEHLWTFEVPFYKRTPHVRTVFPADLDGEGREIAIAGADSWRYYAVDADGSLRWHYESVHASTHGAAADIAGDGRDELILGTEYYWWHVVNPDGSLRFRARTQGGPCANVVAAGDITGDGRIDALFGGADGNIQTWGNDGQFLWMFNTGDEITGLACADATGDGVDEVFATSLSFNVYCIAAGEMLWRTSLGHQIGAMSVLRGEDGARIVAGTDDGRVHVLDAGDGTIVASYEAGARVIDLAARSAGERWPEIIVTTEDGRARALLLPQ